MSVDARTCWQERRDRLASMDDSALGRWLGERVVALRDHAAAIGTEVAAFVGAPLAEVCGSPFGWAAVVRAANDGVAHAHLEYRTQPQWPDELLADAQVADPMHNVWQAGVLHIGKYESFLQDEPLCTYNPNHMAKWTPHEMTHRVCRFFWREGATSWEHYIGSRLNELVPIVLWYGLDEVVRGDDKGFDRARSAAQPWATPSDLDWLSLDDAALRSRAAACVPHLRWALAHFEREWAAIRKEAEQGVRVPTPTDTLDASSDAMAYVVGHLRRLESATFRRMAQGLLTAGEHYDDSIADAMERVEACLDALLFEMPGFDAQLAHQRFAARALWDSVQLKAQAGWDEFRPLMSSLPSLRMTFDSLWQGQVVTSAHDVALTAAREAGATELRELGVLHQPMLGPPNPASIEHGLASLCPRLFERIGGSTERLTALHNTLMEHALADGRRSLLFRLGRIVEGVEAGLLDLESTIATALVSDEDIEVLCHPPESLVDLDWAGLRCVPNRHVRFLAQSDATHLLLQEPGMTDVPASPTGWLAVVYFQGASSVVVACEAIRALWQELMRTGSLSVEDALDILDRFDHQIGGLDLPDSSEDWFGEMVEAGIFGVRTSLGVGG